MTLPACDHGTIGFCETCAETGVYAEEEETLLEGLERLSDKLTRDGSFDDGLPAAAAVEIERLSSALGEALAVIGDYLAYKHDGDPWTEDARTMGEMKINDYDYEGRWTVAKEIMAASAAWRPMAALDHCKPVLFLYADKEVRVGGRSTKSTFWHRDPGRCSQEPTRWMPLENVKDE